MTAITFLLSVVEEFCAASPVLVVTAPKSIVIWEREFLQLSPNIVVVVYSGDKIAQKFIKNHELKFPPRAQLVLTTFDVACNVSSEVLVLKAVLSVQLVVGKLLFGHL